MKNKNWTRSELLACFNLYCRIPFSRIHHRNPDIATFATLIGRTPSAVAMKLVNFASFDPVHRNRNVKGLSNASRADREIWEEFRSDTNRIAEESEESLQKLLAEGQIEADDNLIFSDGPTEKTATRPMRLVQNFFRRTVLASYGYKCSFCRLDVPALLNASHIIPWNASVILRADPRNGLCLCTLHDRAFDRGLIAVDADYSLLVSKRLKVKSSVPLHRVAFLELEGCSMKLPERFLPALESLEHHRNSIFS